MFGFVKLILKIVVAPVVILLTLAIWICVGIAYISGLVLGILSMRIALLGVTILVTHSPQNGLILLVIAFLISPQSFWTPKTGLSATRKGTTIGQGKLFYVAKLVLQYFRT